MRVDTCVSCHADIPVVCDPIIAKVTATAGQPLLMLEAMKMENEIHAPFDGHISTVPVKVGQTVIRGQVLAEGQ